MENTENLSRKYLASAITINLVAAILGLFVLYILGPIPGAATFLVLIILLPLLFHYLYLKRRS
ncbi:MAG: hypothetical protein ABEJ56_02425 [Candidatus Nanohaloarchaea archaeon]